ncbi:hypothetical protein PHMEG_00012705 [Phytophthora megakarya]|uniref:Uncharacterized protein n=1 Tax=Phytophthora megakarya TaxID=4795 RepID=A0A225WAP0_9STRA|nr:hypothetical protein PHMEG_00012705 [Phytophthora megakarya]
MAGNFTPIATRHHPTEDAKPVNARASTLVYVKKAISSFMPRHTVAWDPIRGDGNPTRSDTVNAVIKKVKRFESAARRLIEYDEFINLLELVCSRKDNGSLKYLFSLSMYHLGTILCQLRLSKIFCEERDAPKQIIVGSLESSICALLNLAVCVDASERLFDKMKQGNLETHSLRKGATRYTKRTGVSKDYVNLRGSRRTRKSVVDMYIDNTHPLPDAVAAGTLAGPLGPCCYTLEEGIRAVSDELLTNHVDSAIKVAMGEEVAQILALPLLWASLVLPGSFDYALIPVLLKQRIVRAYSDVGGNVAVNLVKRVPINIAGDGAQLHIINIPDATTGRSEAERAQPGRHNMTAGSTRKAFAPMHSQLFGMQCQMASILNEWFRSRAQSQRNHQKALAVARRIAAEPVAQRVQDPICEALVEATAANGARQRVKLSNDQRICMSYGENTSSGWGEGLKPPRDFTTAERGANTVVFSRRKLFWDVFPGFVRAGFTSDVAIYRVYSTYGR